MLTKTEIMQAAMVSGISVSTMHGQSANKLMPIADAATLIAFYKECCKMEISYEVNTEISLSATV